MTRSTSAAGRAASVRGGVSRPAGAKGRPGQERLAEVARGGVINLVGAFVAAVATVGITVLVTRKFSRPVAGAFFTASSAFLIVESVAGLGANTGLVYFIARLRSLGEERRIPKILRAAVLPVLTVSALATVVMLLLAGPLAHVLDGHLGKGGASPAAVAGALRALALALPFAASLDAFLGASRGYREMRPTVVVDRIGRSVGQVLGVLVAAFLGSAALIAPLWALPYVPAAVVAWLWLRRIRRNPAPVGPVPADIPPALAVLLSMATPVLPYAGEHSGGQLASRRVMRRRLANANPRGFWRFTVPRAIANLASITLQRLDIVLVAVMRGPAEAAVYTAATRFLVAGQFGNMAISMAAQPRFTEFFATGDRQSANVVYQVTTAWLILLTWPLYLLAIVYGPQVLAIFGHSYRAGSVVMVILGFTMLFAMACGQVDVMLITAGRSSWSLINGLISTGVNIGVDLVLIPRYGIMGAAIGWSAAIVVSNLIPLAQLLAVFRLHPVGRGAIAAATLSALSFGVVPLFARAMLGTGGLASAAGLACALGVLLVGLWLLRDALQLSAMPGVSALQRALHRGRR